jgi:hypothetical protein
VVQANHLSKMDHSHAHRRARRFDSAAVPGDLYDYLVLPERRPGRPVKRDLADWRVVDDWPQRVPVTEREVDVVEAWFGDILDELFGTS